jgi:hypothetical protein
VEESDGNLLYGKNPRTWQFEEIGVVYELSMLDRCTIAREHLADVDPTGQISELHLQTLRRWLSNRYARAAFPDTFNERFRHAGGAVTRLLKRNGTNLSGIYLLIDGRELPDGESYDVVLVATMLEDEFNDGSLRSTCAEVLGRVAAAVDECPGISVIEFMLKSERDVSLSDLRELRRWDYDSLSLRDDDSQLPPEDT